MSILLLRLLLRNDSACTLAGYGRHGHAEGTAGNTRRVQADSCVPHVLHGPNCMTPTLSTRPDRAGLSENGLRVKEFKPNIPWNDHLPDSL